MAVLIAFVVLAFVVSEYRGSKARRRLLQLSNEIVDGSAAFIIVLDQHRAILKLNLALLQSIQKDENSLLGKSLLTAGLSENNRLTEALKGDPPVVVESGETIRDRLATSRGEKLVVDWQISMLKGPSGDIMRYIISGLNVTELERTRQKLQNLRENTEREERQKLAEELHDEIGNYLFVSSMKLESLRESPLTADSRMALEELQDTIKTIITRTRSLVFELGPMSTVESGLENALASLTRHMQNRSGVSIQFTGDRLRYQPEKAVNYFLFNSVREIITNAVKHAQANKITVVLRQLPDSIEVEVRDNGKGFNFEETIEHPHIPKGFGLTRLVERCEYFGVGLKVDTSSGSSFRIILPITLKEAHAYSNSIGG